MKKNFGDGSSAKGMTLLELIIASVKLPLIILAGTTLNLAAVKTSRDVFEKIQLQDEAMYVIRSIEKDVNLAADVTVLAGADPIFGAYTEMQIKKKDNSVVSYRYYSNSKRLKFRPSPAANELEISSGLLKPGILTADLNADGGVNADDTNLFLPCYNNTPQPPIDCKDADFNGDGKVDDTDFNLIGACRLGHCDPLLSQVFKVSSNGKRVEVGFVGTKKLDNLTTITTPAVTRSIYFQKES